MLQIDYKTKKMVLNSIFPAILKVNVPIVSKDGSGSRRNVTLFLGTCEANRTKPTCDKLVIKSLPQHYEDVLNENFNCVVKDTKKW